MRQRDSDIDSRYVYKYYSFIEYLKKVRGRPVGTYNNMPIRNYYKNIKIPPFGWKYNRHHIKEIKISGAIYKNLKEYQTDEVILVDYIEHYLLHYLIVLAGTTTPNYGMVMPLIGEGYTMPEAIIEWDSLVARHARRYRIEYVPNWHTKLRF